MSRMYTGGCKRCATEWRGTRVARSL